MIQRAIQDWTDNPVLTTLDTIVAPIEDIQFPTVTVCPDESHDPDNWAAIETILNNFEFSCGTDVHNTGSYTIPCNNTKEVREDFQFLIATVVEIYKIKFSDNKTMGSALIPTNEIKIGGRYICGHVTRAVWSVSSGPTLP